MTRYSSVTIIYNPKATGSGKRMAHELEQKILVVGPKLPIKVIPTEYAGHAEKLAYQAAKHGPRPLVISASGDGGYHEVVNGLMQAQKEGAHPTAGLLPAGNANDHYRNLHSNDIAKAVEEGTNSLIDVLKLEATVDKRPYIRYAHSYIGVGLNAEMAHRLNHMPHTFWKEIAMTMRLMTTAHHTEFIVGGKKQANYGLIFSNVPTMAKWFTMARHARSDDGLFEITRFKARSRARLILKVLLAVAFGFNSAESVQKFNFKTVSQGPVQLDGEVVKIDADVPVSIGIARKQLRCIV